MLLLAHSESAYSLIWGAKEICGLVEGESLALYDKQTSIKSGSN